MGQEILRTVVKVYLLTSISFGSGSTSDVVVHHSVGQDPSEKIILQGRPPRNFSGHCNACVVNVLTYFIHNTVKNQHQSYKVGLLYNQMKNNPVLKSHQYILEKI